MASRNNDGHLNWQQVKRYEQTMDRKESPDRGKVADLGQPKVAVVITPIQGKVTTIPKEKTTP
jgi:hypothetical protein